MNIRIARPMIIAATLLFALFFAEPAAAFRCGTKLVQEGMHEIQVIAVCGEPTTMRHLGYALRSYDLRVRRRLSPGWTEYRSGGYGFYSQEVMITEYVYNFGPRKKMRRLIFEGGILVTIEQIGYGYHEKRR